MSKVRIVRLGMVAAILAITILLPAETRAAWRFGAQIYLQEEQVCRDGVLISIAYFADQAQSQANSPINVTASARLYTETSLPTRNSSSQDYPFDYYGPLLTSALLTMSYHDTPIEDPAGIDGKFYTYSLNNTVPWTRQLAVGSTVLLHGGNATWPVTVQDCALNRPTVNEGATLTLGNTYLKGDDGTIAPDELMYRIGTVPINGSLLLNGVPLTAGAFFTQDDVDNNRLSYLHNGSETTSDSFSFSVAATTRVSVATNGAEAAGGNSYDPAITGDARSIAFTSNATNLTSGDINGVADIFVRDRIAAYCRPANTTTRVSVDSSGAEGNATSTTASINDDATRIAFESTATNLVTGDTNGQQDIFVHRRFFGVDCTPTPQTVRASVTSSSAQANLASSGAAISGDGFDIAFQSLATDLVSGDTAGHQDIFDQSNSNFTYRLTGPSTLSVQGDSASDSSSISSNGDSIAFRSDATNLVTGDTNAQGDIFVWRSYDIARVSVSTSGVQANDDSFTPRLSAAGNTVVFQSRATNLVADDTSGGSEGADIFVHDRTIITDTSTTRVSLGARGVQANGASANPATSAGGRYIVFQSNASNLVSGDTNSCRFLFGTVNCSDIFVHDRVSGTTRRISVDSTGAQSNGHSYNASMSHDGSYIAFDSYATNLVSGDSNAMRDVFLRYIGFSSSFPITINPVNDVPAAQADSYNVDEDTLLTDAAPGVLANDSDAEGTALTAVLVDNPAHGTVTLAPNGSFSYQPDANYNGPDSFTYRANDGSANSNVATASLTINPVNDPPVARNEGYQTNEDTALVVPIASGVLVNDADVDSTTMTALLVAQPQHGSLTMNQNGSFSYTPVANYAGADSFTYRANDGAANSNIATVSITVTPVNDAPIATADTYQVAGNVTLEVLAGTGVLRNDTDVDTATLTAVLVTGPQHGSLTLNPNGSFRYTPVANYAGPDSFTYRANDGKANSNIVTVSITVTASTVEKKLYMPMIQR